MKVRVAPRARKVVLEMGPRDSSLPPSTLPELRLRKILVPIDFSEPSRKALAYATSFAKQFNAELLLFHAVPLLPMPAPIYLDQGETEARLHEEATKQLAQWQKELSSQVSVSAKAVVRHGTNAYDQIVTAATEYNIDLIILGTHGRAGAARWFIGSTAERVVRHAPCPVLVVRERGHDFVAESGAKRTLR